MGVAVAVDRQATRIRKHGIRRPTLAIRCESLHSRVIEIGHEDIMAPRICESDGNIELADILSLARHMLTLRGQGAGCVRTSPMTAQAVPQYVEVSLTFPLARFNVLGTVQEPSSSWVSSRNRRALSTAFGSKSCDT